MIAFASNRNQYNEDPSRQSRIYVMNADGSGVKRLTPEPPADEIRAGNVSDNYPSISPDGSRVAFISNRTVFNSDGYRPFDIYIVNTDGTGLSKITNFQPNPGNGPMGSEFHSVAWSPDGTKLAYRALRIAADGAFRDVLGAINPDGTGETILSVVYSDGGEMLDWSPDGTRIMFSHSSPGSGTVQPRFYTLSDSSVVEYNIPSFNSGGAGTARFSPDGQRMVYYVYEASGDLSPQVMVISNLDGSNRTTVTRGVSCAPVGIAWVPGPAVPAPARLDLIPGPASIYAGGPSLQLMPILYDANNKVLARAAREWQISPSGGDRPGIDDQGLVTPTTTNTSSITLQACALNGGLKTCVDVLLNPVTNPIDDPETFVRQHYTDFLARASDPDGLAFWKNQITSCNGDAGCIDRRRVNTSGAYFLSTEFQTTGYFVYRLYKGALNRRPKFSEFVPDLLNLTDGIVVNNRLSDQAVEDNKNNFAAKFTALAEFKAIYDSLDNTGYVNKLADTVGVTVADADRQALINGLATATETRVTVLRKLLDGTTTTGGGNLQFTTTYGKAFYDKEYNPAFVLMQYFGYLRRDPDSAGYQFWLNKLNHYGNFTDAEMVRSFILSEEYRKRFGKQ